MSIFPDSKYNSLTCGDPASTFYLIVLRQNRSHGRYDHAQALLDKFPSSDEVQKLPVVSSEKILALSHEFQLQDSTKRFLG